MRVCDYLASKLVEIGVKDVFLVTGGGSMFLTDGLACNEKLNKIPCLHEQGAAMAAVANAHYNENYGACFVTTGCGATNTITGILHAWQDHIPVIFVSGQCNRNERITSVKTKVRAIGQQEVNIVPIVESITKYAVTIVEPDEAVYHIEKAIYLAKEGCWGPVYLDVPMDIQEAEINPENLKHFSPSELIFKDYKPTDEDIAYIKKALEESERPIVIMGAGIRDGKAIEDFDEFIHKNNIPFVGTRRGWDILPKSDELHVGLADIRGNRAANMAMQNADLVLVLGSRLSVFTTGYNYELFARGAKKIIAVNVDSEELNKGTVRIDRKVVADVKSVLQSLKNIKLNSLDAWREKCLHWKDVFPVFTDDQNIDSDGMSKFAFIRELNNNLKEDSVVITDAGATTEIPMQGLVFNSKKQRYIGSATQCEMGYSLPACVGVGTARNKKDVIVIVGDGSLQMNIQELQTIQTQKIPAKIFVWNNGRYGSIYGHQKGLFKGRFVGVDESSGTIFPNLEKIANAYGYKYLKVSNIKELKDKLPSIMNDAVAVICDVLVWKEEANPMVKGKMRLSDGSRIALAPEDMFPPVDRELFVKEMIIEPIKWW